MKQVRLVCHACTADGDFLNLFPSYEESATMYAKTHNPFEEVALKFLSLKDKEPLQTFIMEKLESLKPQVSTVFQTQGDVETDNLLACFASFQSLFHR